MSGYLTGVLVVLAFNVIAAYAVYLPLAAGQLNLGIAGFMASAPMPRPSSPMSMASPCGWRSRSARCWRG